MDIVWLSAGVAFFISFCGLVRFFDRMREEA